MGYLPPLRQGYLDTITRNDSALNFWLRCSYHSQVTHTYYDSVAFRNLPFVQQNLRKRISTITYADFGYYTSTNDTIKDTVGLLVVYRVPKDTNLYDNAIHYTYDIEGNVVTQLTDIPNDSLVRQRFKRTDYYYDLVSGKVNELIYQHDSTDQFMQAYEYDADNRITDVLTSHDSLYWEQDADYQYYWHGPLAREELGRRQVQGLDYAYTLNGWIKGVDSSITMPNFDMGLDGYVHGPNADVARDAYGFTLNYFNGDYRAIGAANFEATGLPITSLYNGNIAGAAYAIKHLKPGTVGWVYEYDQLNRYRGQTTWIHPDRMLDNWSTGNVSPAAEEKVNYDENGNILTYIRHGNTTVGPEAMDSLNYNYKKGTNQLTNVRDAVPATNYSTDIDDEPSKYNYRYNSIGQLAKDSAGKLDTIIWNVYGKIQEIDKPSITNPGYEDRIEFVYDPLGNRLKKLNFINITPCHICLAQYNMDTTNNSRDAQGNILAVYYRKRDTVKLTEWDLYGSKRLGTLDTNLLVYPPVATYTTVMDSITISYLEGQKQYELTNHLGNVLAAINDRKLGVDTNHDGHTDYYLSNTISAGDYCPFGMPIPGRRFQLLADSSYHFGFNDKLKDNEVYGEGDFYDYGMRMYNPRGPVFISVDPLAKKYPFYSPYMFAADKPIRTIDIDGLEVPPGALEPVEEDNLSPEEQPEGLTYPTREEIDREYEEYEFFENNPEEYYKSIENLEKPKDEYIRDKDGNILWKIKNEDVKDQAKKSENNVNNTTTKANDGITKSSHGGKEHNTAIDNRVEELKKDAEVKNIRKNQKQVDYNGKRVGNNQPDVQYDKDGKHYDEEYDNVIRNSKKHGEVIKKNDPDAIVKLNILRPKKK